MILYYAMGGGLGHLTRAHAMLHTLEIKNDYAILTSSPFANDKRVVGDTQIVPVPRTFEKDVADFRLWLAETFEKFCVEEIFIDTFPTGIKGEFCGFDFGEIKLNYVARLLKWSAYKPLFTGQSPQFENSFLLEPLETEHENFIDSRSRNKSSLELIYPPMAMSNDVEKIINIHSPFWLVVHSGNEEEISELLEYANEMRQIEVKNVDLILVTSKFSLPLPSNTFHYDLYPASLLLPHTERIISGCGFNIINQAREFREKHFVIPFPRRYDDQYARAAKCFGKDFSNAARL